MVSVPRRAFEVEATAPRIEGDGKTVGLVYSHRKDGPGQERGEPGPCAPRAFERCCGFYLKCHRKSLEALMQEVIRSGLHGRLRLSSECGESR